MRKKKSSYITRLKNACKFRINLLDLLCCAKWGVCGALNLQSAIAGPNVFPDGTSGRLRFIRSVDYKVLCNLPLRTVSGQGCSSTKQTGRCDV